MRIHGLRGTAAHTCRADASAPENGGEGTGGGGDRTAGPWVWIARSRFEAILVHAPTQITGYIHDLKKLA